MFILQGNNFNSLFFVFTFYPLIPGDDVGMLSGMGYYLEGCEITSKEKPNNKKETPSDTRPPSNWDGVPRGERITSSGKNSKKN